MKKLLVETTGEFELVDFNRQEIPYFRPSVVVETGFVSHRAAVGQVRILHTELEDDVTDADFAGFWESCEGDYDLAVASFIAAFGN